MVHEVPSRAKAAVPRARRSGALRTALALAILAAVGWSARTDAAPEPQTLAAAIKAARCVLVSARSNVSDYPKLAPDPTVRVESLAPHEVHLRLVSQGKPVETSELRKLTWAMCEALADVGVKEPQHVIIDFYADARLSRPTSDTSTTEQGVFDHDPAFRGDGQRYVLSERFVDTTRPVNWYARALWWKPWRMRDRRLVGLEGWQFDAWYVAGNASPRPEEGGAAFAPVKVK